MLEITRSIQFPADPSWSHHSVMFLIKHLFVVFSLVFYSINTLPYCFSMPCICVLWWLYSSGHCILPLCFHTFKQSLFSIWAKWSMTSLSLSSVCILFVFEFFPGALFCWYGSGLHVSLHPGDHVFSLIL